MRSNDKDPAARENGETNRPDPGNQKERTNVGSAEMAEAPADLPGTDRVEQMSHADESDRLVSDERTDAATAGSSVEAQRGFPEGREVDYE